MVQSQDMLDDLRDVGREMDGALVAVGVLVAMVEPAELHPERRIHVGNRALENEMPTRRLESNDRETVIGRVADDLREIERVASMKFRELFVRDAPAMLRRQRSLSSPEAMPRMGRMNRALSKDDDHA